MLFTNKTVISFLPKWIQFLNIIQWYFFFGLENISLMKRFVLVNYFDRVVSEESHSLNLAKERTEGTVSALTLPFAYIISSMQAERLSHVKNSCVIKMHDRFFSYITHMCVILVWEKFPVQHVPMRGEGGRERKESKTFMRAV